jgi:hypothetical protein
MTPKAFSERHSFASGLSFLFEKRSLLSETTSFDGKTRSFVTRVTNQNLGSFIAFSLYHLACNGPKWGKYGRRMLVHLSLSFSPLLDDPPGFTSVLKFFQQHQRKSLSYDETQKLSNLLSVAF